MSSVTGTVKKCIQSKFGWGLMLEEEEGKWYNSKFEIKCSTGDSVTFDDGGKNYVNKLKVNTGGVVATGTSVVSTPTKTHYLPVPLDNSRAIIRQNALTNAREYFTVAGTLSGTESDVDSIIKIARIFENYTSGDADMEVAKKALNKMEAA